MCRAKSTGILHYFSFNHVIASVGNSGCGGLTLLKTLELITRSVDWSFRETFISPPIFFEFFI